MEFNINLTSTDIVAWWGAILATTVLVWDIYKWKTSGSKLRLLVQTGMKLMGDPETEDDTFVTFKVTNIGDRPTTITVVGFKYYKSWLDKYRNKTDKAFVIPNPQFNHQVLPYILEVGQEWMGGTKQTDDVIDMAKNGYLILELCDSVHKKPSTGRVVVHD